MQMDQLTLEKFEKMFQRQPDGFAQCKLCKQEIMLLDSDEVEFWRHQVDRQHLDYLINYYLSYDQDLFLKNRKQNEGYEINKASYREKKVNKLEKEMYKEAKRIMKTSEGSSSNQLKFMVDQLDKLMLKKQSNYQIIRRARYYFSCGFPYETNDDNNLESALSLNQIYQNQKRLEPTQESFQSLVEEYFNILIVELIKRQELTEAICFLLARIGISSKEISEINFATIYSQIQELKGKFKDLPHLILVLKVLKQLSQKLEKQIGEKNKGFLIRQPKKPKELRKKLESLRKKLKNETAFKDNQRFLERLKVKSLNALFKIEMKNQMLLMNRGLPQDQVNKEQDEFYIDITNKDDGDGSLEIDDQSGIFKGIEINPYKEQQQAQEQSSSENQSILEQQINSQGYVSLERVIEIIMKFEQKRINKKQQMNLKDSNYNLIEGNLEQSDQRNQEQDDQEESSDDENEESDQ